MNFRAAAALKLFRSNIASCFGKMVFGISILYSAFLRPPEGPDSTWRIQTTQTDVRESLFSENSDALSPPCLEPPFEATQLELPLLALKCCDLYEILDFVTK